MPRHSKNNTASAVFTYAERERLKYGTQRQRVGQDSMRAVDSCFLCLQTAVAPTSCPQGHIACKECFLSNIVAQRKEIELGKASAASRQAAAQLIAAQKEEKRIAETLRTASDFNSVTGTSKDANRAIEKPVLPSYWIPSLTPSADNCDDKDLSAASTFKKSVQCQAAPGKNHVLRAKDLFPVCFNYDKETKRHTCRSCVTQINAGASVYLLRTCGHVLCATCAGNMDGMCPICEKRCKSSRDVLRINSEGTSFSAAGNVCVEKFDVAFQ